MLRETIEHIGRVRDILGTNTDFFDAIKEWYGNVKLTQKVIRLMVTKSRSGARVLLTVNGHMLAGDAVNVAARARHITWVLPSALLATGDNGITLSLDAGSRSALYLQGVAAFQERGLPRQDIDLSVADPAPALCMALAEFADVYHCEHSCCMSKTGYMTFRLQLAERAALTFSLDLPNDGSEAWIHDLEEVTKEVLQRVRDRCRELEGQRRRAEQFDQCLAQRLSDEIRDLEVYSELHRQHIEPALQSAPDATLDEVMTQLGDPDRLVRMLTTELAQVVAVEVRPPQPQQFARVEVVQSPPRTLSSAPGGSLARRSGGGFFKTCFVLLATLGTVAGGGAAIWSKAIEPLLKSGSKVSSTNPMPTGVNPGGVDTKAGGLDTKEPVRKPLGNFNGDWDTRLGWTSYGFPRQMTLRQSGDHVEGEFREELEGRTVNGKILDGKVVGDTLKFRWFEAGHRGSQPGADGQGDGEFTLSSDGKGFSGTYTGPGCEKRNGWRGWRK